MQRGGPPPPLWEQGATQGCCAHPKPHFPASATKPPPKLGFCPILAAVPRWRTCPGSSPKGLSLIQSLHPAHSTRHQSWGTRGGKLGTSLSEMLSQGTVAHDGLLFPVLALPGAILCLASPFPTTSAHNGDPPPPSPPKKNQTTHPTNFWRFPGYLTLWGAPGVLQPPQGRRQRVFARAFSHSISLQPSPSRKRG